MSGRNLESFMEDADAFSALSEDDKARLFSGEALEGETALTDDAADAVSSHEVKESSATPDAAEADDTTKDQSADPVVLAKDGSHTIPFSVLETERQRVRDLEQRLQSFEQAANDPPKNEVADSSKIADSTTTADAELKVLFAERDEAFYNGDPEKAADLNAKIFAIQQERATQAAIDRIDARNAERKAEEDQARTVSDIDARVSAAVEKYPFLDFKGPEANKDAIDLVVAQRDLLIARGVPAPAAIDQAVAKVAPLFIKETTESKPDAAQKAAEVISKAKTQVPTSLSSVPAGASAHHDEAEAIRNRSGLSLLNTFEGKSADDILKLMSRVI